MRISPRRTRSRCARLRPRPHPRRLPRPPARPRGLGRDFDDFLDARRLDLGDDLVAVGQQRHVARDVRSRTWIVGVEVDERSIEYSMDCGRWSGSARTRTVSVGWRSVPPWSSTAGDMPVATSGTSTVSSSVIRTRNRSTWSGPAVDRVDLDRWNEDRLGLLAVDRQVDERVRAGVAAELLELVGVDRDAGRSRRRGRRRRPAGGRRGAGGRPSCR